MTHFKIFMQIVSYRTIENVSRTCELSIGINKESVRKAPTIIWIKFFRIFGTDTNRQCLGELVIYRTLNYAKFSLGSSVNKH